MASLSALPQYNTHWYNLGGEGGGVLGAWLPFLAYLNITLTGTSSEGRGGGVLGAWLPFLSYLNITLTGTSWEGRGEEPLGPGFPFCPTLI